MYDYADRNVSTPSETKSSLHLSNYYKIAGDCFHEVLTRWSNINDDIKFESSNDMLEINDEKYICNVNTEAIVTQTVLFEYNLKTSYS